jgi:signal transduction histidine kinase
MADTKRRFRPLWTAHPVWALVETWLVGLLILFPLSQTIEYLPSQVFDNGILVLCGACGLWMVLRTRVPQLHPLLQVGWELGVAIALGLLMAVGFRLSTDLLGWSDVWSQSNLGSITSILLVLTAPGYLVARIAVRLWLLWDRARRRRMLLSLTHAHLALVVLVMAAFVVFLVIGLAISENPGSYRPESGGLVAVLIDRIFHSLIPLLGIWTVMMIIAVIVMLPPSAVFSYFVARHTTRRLERLAATARAMREGDYGARVSVEGEDEVAQLQADFNTMAGELERTLRDLEAERDTVSHLLQSRRELIATVSHELRTPVATLRAMLESALKQGETPPPALRGGLAVMEGEVLRLQGLIDDLFTLSQAEVEKLALDCHSIDVAPVVRRSVAAMAPLAWQSGRVEVVAELPEELPPICADEARLEQILANLLRNSMRHTPPGGIVAVITAAEADVVRIEVRDTGEGIPPEELPRVWDRFYRGESARSSGARRSHGASAEDNPGAGLGLALVKELTEAMGGTVAVESQVGQGSTFTVRLPLAQTTSS